MDDLQDAFEDAKYLNAVQSSKGLSPVKSWVFPEIVQLNEFQTGLQTRNPNCFAMERICEQTLGYFTFREFCRSESEFVALKASFMADVLRFKRLCNNEKRSLYAKFIIDTYLSSKLTSTVLEMATQAQQGNFPTQRPTFVGAEDDDKGLARKGLLKVSLNEKNSFEVIPPPSRKQSIQSVTRTITLQRKSEYNRVINALLVRGPGVDFLTSIKFNLPSNQEDMPEKIAEDLKEQTHTIKEVDQERQIREVLLSLQSEVMGNCQDQSSTVQFNSRLFDPLESWVFEQLQSNVFESYLRSNWFKDYLKFFYIQHEPLKENDFVVFRLLGRGGFGEVNGCKRTTTGKLYAMKKMSRKHIKAKKSEDMCWNERRVLQHANSKFLVSLKYAYVNEQSLFLILDLMTGGDLSFHLSQMGTFTENMARYYIARTVLGLDHLHGQGIVYRDLKPENLLLCEDGRSKMSDMGLACIVHPQLKELCGTRGYWAPEMLARDKNGQKKGYDCRVDWFALGCVLFEFLAGECPFRTERALKWNEETVREVEKRMDQATLEMEPEYSEKRFSEEAKDLCEKLLMKNPNERIGKDGCIDIMLHPWFSSMKWDELASDTLTPPFVPSQKINATSLNDIRSLNEGLHEDNQAITEVDINMFKKWNFTNETAYQDEIVEYLKFKATEGNTSETNQEKSSCCIVM